MSEQQRERVECAANARARQVIAERTNKPSEASVDRQSLENTLFGRVAWRLIPFLILCYGCAYLDRVNVGFAKLEMLADLGFSETTYGVAAGSFFIGYLIFGVPSNLMLHRFGARRWIAGMMVVWGVLSGAMTFVHTPAQFFALRFLIGVAEAGFYPGIILYLTYWFPSARRATMWSLFQTAIPLSGVFGGPISGWILVKLRGWYSYNGWQWLFLLEAIPAVVAGLVASRYLDNGISHARWLTPTEKEFLLHTIGSDTPRGRSTPVRAVFKDWRVWKLSILVFGLIMGLAGLSFWMPTLLHDAGARSNETIGWLSAIPNVVATIGMVAFAYNSHGRRASPIRVAVSAALGGAGLAATAIFSDSLVLTIISLSLASVGILSACPMQWSLVTAFLGGSEAAAAIGFINSVGCLAGFVSPAFVGWIAESTGSATPAMYTLAACVASSAAISLTMSQRTAVA
jgi:MFS family permease